MSLPGRAHVRKGKPNNPGRRSRILQMTREVICANVVDADHAILDSSTQSTPNGIAPNKPSSRGENSFWAEAVASMRRQLEIPQGRQWRMDLDSKSRPLKICVPFTSELVKGTRTGPELCTVSATAAIPVANRWPRRPYPQKISSARPSSENR